MNATLSHIYYCIFLIHYWNSVVFLHFLFFFGVVINDTFTKTKKKVDLIALQNT